MAGRQSYAQQRRSNEPPHTAISTPLGKVGLLICWDLAFPEAFRALIAQGAKIIVIPTFWTLADCSVDGRKRNPLAEELFLESMVVARTFENTCALVFCNVGGERGRGERRGYGFGWSGMLFTGLDYWIPHALFLE